MAFSLAGFPISILIRLVALTLFFLPGQSSAQLKTPLASTHPQAPLSIYPVPQHIQFKQDSLPFYGIRLTAGLKMTGEDNIVPLLTPFTGKTGKSIAIHLIKPASKAVEIPKEGYTLKIMARQIQIRYQDPRGAFYGVQTLIQILNHAKRTGFLPLLDIMDYPDIPRRGIVEGFYGTPWTFQDRVDQLRFYGKWKINTYIYGPKDDIYHSSPNWRQPYPKDQAARLKELIHIARQNEVDFYWAIHPGKDIQWNQADSLAIIHKLQSMYDLGVRHFAVFFDDIAGEGAKAQKQAGLLNYIQNSFISQHSDIGPLIMCPTEYNKLWADPKPNTYLDILGQHLDKRIEIMWTGNSVIHDITKEGEDWVNNRIGRKAFVWWNFPVNDYVRNHLLLGPVYGLDKDLPKNVSGFVANPMDKAAASKVAIFSVADFCWNTKAYLPDASWQKGIQQVLPEVAHSYKIFAQNNTDPGPSYHQYRRIESPAIQSVLDTLLARTDQFTKFPIKLTDIDLSALNAVCQSFSPAVQDILMHIKDTALLREIKPWLWHFASLGKAATALTQLLSAPDSKKAFPYFLQLQNARNQLIAIDRQYNRNPYQPGIVTGGRHIQPWIEKSYYHFAEMFKKQGWAVPDAIDQASGQVITSLPDFKQLSVQKGVAAGNKPVQVLKLSPILEVLRFNPGDYMGIAVKSNTSVTNQVITTQPSLEKSGLQIAYSKDGISWQADRDADTKQIRLINATGQPISFKLERFDILLQ